MIILHVSGRVLCVAILYFFVFVFFFIFISRDMARFLFSFSIASSAVFIDARNNFNSLSCIFLLTLFNSPLARCAFIRRSTLFLHHCFARIFVISRQNFSVACCNSFSKSKSHFGGRMMVVSTVFAMDRRMPNGGFPSAM